MLAAIGPVWDGNEVWLIAAGGVLFVAFPRVYATAFSGFYMALIIVLWLLILRGVAIEFRSHQDNPLWREFWDTIFMVASALLAVVFGATLGNLDPRRTRRGARSAGHAAVHELPPRPRAGHPRLVHGARRPLHARRPGGPRRPVPRVEDDRARAGAQPGLRPPGVEGRARALGRRDRRHRLGAARGLRGPRRPPLGLRLRRARDRRGLGVIPVHASAAATSPRSSARPRSCSGWWPPPWRANYPFWLRSTLDPSYSLTASNAASDRYGMGVALIWWAVGIALVAGYFTYLFRSMRGKVGAEPAPSYGRSTLCFLRRGLPCSRRRMT